tara:strand:+ start:572 stop:766 length:195 start_codon:yes stop_codon:yes gene_type:complete
VSTAQELLSDYQQLIKNVNLITGDNGVFDVHIGDELVYSKDKTGRHIFDGEILQIMQGVIDADV